MKNQNIILSGFLANLLGIILGIILTFGVSSLWQKHQEKKKTKEMLVLVRNELEINKKWFQDMGAAIEKDCYIYQKILESKNNWESLPSDTLDAYFIRIVNIYFSPLYSSAWQIFHNSEMIQNIDNKELVIRLTECYFWIDKIQRYFETEYLEKKKKALVPAIVEHPAQYLDTLMNHNESVVFYTAMAKVNPLQPLFLFVESIIDYNILLLDKYGDFKYDMGELDKEYEAFIEERRNILPPKNDTTENNN
jgi:hypothetical protein